MDDRIGNLSEMGFADCAGHVSRLDHNQFADILMASADVVLIINLDDKVVDVSFSSEEIFAGGGRGWRGRPILEIVTSESEDKIHELLKAARQERLGNPRQVNHPLPEADDLPITYRAMKFNENGDVILFGQSASQVASLQRRMMSSQLAMEREVAKLRGSESRYRAAFQLSKAAQIMVEAASLRILDINTAAAALLGKSSQKLEGKKIVTLFDDMGGSVLHKLLLATVDNHDNGDADIELSNGDVLNIRTVPFRQDGKTNLLLYVTPVDAASTPLPNTTELRILSLVKDMPDAFVVTNSDLTVITANKSFFDLLNISGIDEVNGAELDRFFERPAVDCKVLIANIKEHNVVRRFASAMKTRFGQVVNVEIAACQLKVEEETVLGFWIRPTNNIIMGAEVEQEKISRSNEQIANLVGHMPLKDIVKETTEMIEALCIETALELTQNNRASAAQMLGVSRQSLYTKLGNSKGFD